MKNYEFILLFTGILLCLITAKILKKIIKQNRPIKSKTYGMPSSRSIVLTFIVFYLIFTNNFSIKAKYIVFVLLFLSLIMKYLLKEHSLNQLLVGSILGFIISFLFSKIKFKLS